MLSHCNADQRKMIFKTEIDTRSSIRREWEELRNQILQTTALSRSIGHGDANTWILELNDPNTREKAMQNLCSHHRNVPDLGVLLWYSFGAVSSLIQEVMVAYLKPNIDKMEGMRIVLALSLLERIAEHPRSRIMFVCSKLHEIVAPLARVGPVSAPAETFRRGALQVIAALFNTENWDRAIIAEKEYGYVAVQFLVDDYLFSVIWNSAKHGQVVSQTVVIQILAKIISNDELFTIFSRKTHALKNLYCALEHMHSCFRLNLPGLCPLVESLYERVERRRLSSSLPKVSTPIGSEMSSIRRLRQSLA